MIFGVLKQRDSRKDTLLCIEEAFRRDGVDYMDNVTRPTMYGFFVHPVVGLKFIRIYNRS